MMKYFRLVLAFLILVALTACSRADQLGQPNGGHENIEEASGQDKYLYGLNETTNHFSLQIDYTVEKGIVSWQVLNPQDEVVWEGQAAAGEQQVEIQELPMEVGTWTLVVDLENVTGGYTYEWIKQD